MSGRFGGFGSGFGGFSFGAPKTESKSVAQKFDVSKLAVVEKEVPKYPAGVGLEDVFLAQVANPKFADVTFIVGEEKERIPAHKMILALRSPVFESMLFKFFPEQKGCDTNEIALPRVKPAIFKLLLQALYADKARITPDNCSDLLVLAKRYQVESLIGTCVQYMTEGFTPVNVCAWFGRAADGSAESKSALAFIEDNTKETLDSEEFLNLNSDAVARICRSNRLSITELELFQASLKWASAECKRTKREDDAKNRSEILKPILAAIRFPLMDMESIANIVSPAAVLPPDHLIGLFTYVGAKSSVSDMPRIPFSLPYGTRPREPRKPFAHFKWDNTRCSPLIRLAKDGITASIGGSGGSGHVGWGSVVSDTEWRPRSGIYEWEIELVTYDTTNTFNVVIGVVPTSTTDYTFGSSTFAYAGQPGWALITGTGQMSSQTHNGLHPDPYYGGGRRGRTGAINNTGHTARACRQGDIIGCRLNTDRGTLEFFKGGRSMTPPAVFTGINVAVRAAISLVSSQTVRVSWRGGYAVSGSPSDY